MDAVEPVQDVIALKDLTDAARDAAIKQGYQLIAEVLAAGIRVPLNPQEQPRGSAMRCARKHRPEAPSLCSELLNSIVMLLKPPASIASSRA